MAESSILPAYQDKARELYGYPWLEKLENSPGITVYQDRDSDDFGGLPKDAVSIWNIVGQPPNECWIVECSSGAILHVMNNKERFVKAPTFASALCALFPNHKRIGIRRIYTRVETETIR